MQYEQAEIRPNIFFPNTHEKKGNTQTKTEQHDS